MKVFVALKQIDFCDGAWDEEDDAPIEHLVPIAGFRVIGVYANAESAQCRWPAPDRIEEWEVDGMLTAIVKE